MTFGFDPGSRHSPTGCPGRERDRFQVTNDSQLTITPDTKVAELLEHYPQLEDVLIGIAAPFKKLKNLWVSNSLSGRRWQLNQVPAVRCPPYVVEVRTGYRVSESSLPSSLRSCRLRYSSSFSRSLAG